mmetsp:Transcript_30998/g.89317  ORF Transcript_30998/g.89317 Transcript_30998/m.89317 type:complete len:226 (+) Transcript_30998:61-738(+)
MQCGPRPAQCGCRGFAWTVVGALQEEEIRGDLRFCPSAWQPWVPRRFCQLMAQDLNAGLMVSLEGSVAMPFLAAGGTHTAGMRMTSALSTAVVAGHLSPWVAATSSRTLPGVLSGTAATLPASARLGAIARTAWRTARRDATRETPPRGHVPSARRSRSIWRGTFAVLSRSRRSQHQAQVVRPAAAARPTRAAGPRRSSAASTSRRCCGRGRRAGTSHCWRAPST